MCAMVRKERALGAQDWGTPPGRSPRPTGPQAGRTAHCEGRAPAGCTGSAACAARWWEELAGSWGTGPLKRSLPERLDTGVG